MGRRAGSADRVARAVGTGAGPSRGAALLAHRRHPGRAPKVPAHGIVHVRRVRRVLRGAVSPRRHHFGCARHYDRGPAVCGNGKLVRRDVLEAKVLAHVFGDLFAPLRLAYLSKAVDAALRDARGQSASVLAAKEAALRQARQDLENIAAAIRQGILTPTTRAMLGEAEARVTRLEEAVRDLRRRPAPVVSLASSVTRYLDDLRGTLETNVEGILQLHDGVLPAGVGAGSPVPMQPARSWIARSWPRL